MIIMAGFFAFQALRYAPDTTFIAGGYSSDTAIPVLMANSDHTSLFSLYYWGQDRFGSWPFLVYQFAADAFAFHWEAIHIFLGMYLFLHLSILVFCWRRGFIPLLVLLGPLHFWPQVSNYLFDIAQPYGWQLASILLALTAAERSGRSRTAAFFFGLCSFLAIWLSPSSVLYCLGMPFLMMSERGLSSPTRWKQLGRLSLPPLLGYLFHSLLRRMVVEHNNDAYYHGYETPLKWESRWIDPAFRAVIQHLDGTTEILIWLVAGALLLLAALDILRRSLRQDGSGLLPQLSSRVLRNPASLTLLSGSILFVIALLPLNWFAANLYGARYIALPRYLMATGFLLLMHKLLLHYLPFTLRPISNFGPMRNLLSLLLTVALLIGFNVFGQMLFQKREVSDAFLFRRSVARALEEMYPGVPLLGNYWETYVYASLQRHGSLPQPGTGQYQRTPFLLPDFLQSDRILVILRGYPAALAKNESVDGGQKSEPRRIITFRSVEYQLIEFKEIHGLPVALYRKSEKPSANR
ncbi:MAG: hypothetical protein KDK23_03205 [Leptospiraceae bacterium]|nr:hypothetical protein [Leptospiraceae bacterium]